MLSFAVSASTVSFDADWRFLKGDAIGAEKPEFDDSTWRRVDVPHDWSIEGPFDEKNLTGGAGGYLPYGIVWYRKKFYVKEMSKRYFVEFDGVMGNSEVWINGVSLGRRVSGYVSFVHDLFPNLKLGENVIAVKASTLLQPASRWYTGGGIYRHVRMTTADWVHFTPWSVFVTTPKIDTKNAAVNVDTEIANDSWSATVVTLQVDIIGPDGRTVATGEKKSAEIKERRKTSLSLSLDVPKPRLWNVGDGVMYKAVVRARSGGKLLDERVVPFGIREFHFDAKTGFWLNGKNFKINGVCLHHDGSAFGAAVPLAVWERRLNELRKLGTNAIRTAHNPPAPEFLDLADRMGFLVMDELFDQWTVAKNKYDYHLYFNEWSKRDVTDTVRRDRNHPSIILWSAGNEIHDTPKADIAIPILKGLVETFHASDPTRPVTQGLFRPNVSKDYQNGLADLLDVVGQNYREKEILAAHKQKPTRKIIGTENTHDINQWLALRDNPEYSGQFIWSGIDYIGESGGWPAVAYGSGLLWRTGQWRPIAYQRQSWWTKTPMVHIARRIARTPKLPADPGYNPAEEMRPQVLFADWSPKNRAAHQENVEVYSNCEEVELFLNGKSLGKKAKPADDSPRNWMVDYEEGTIRAVGYNGGKAVANFELNTAGAPAKLVVTVDKTRLLNHWDDVAAVTVKVTDANGVLVPDASDLVSFKIDGAGVIANVDSADNSSHELFQATERRAYQGVCFANLKAKANSGKIVLTASAPGLKSASVTLVAVAK